MEKKRKSWNMFAIPVGDEFHHAGSRWYAEAHDDKNSVIAVVVIEDKHGKYYGWIDKDDDYPTMIWPSELLFGMCFPYGYKVEEKRGAGKHIRLSISKRD